MSTSYMRKPLLRFLRGVMLGPIQAVVSAAEPVREVSL